MVLQVDTQALIVNKGDIILIPPNTLHGAARYNDSPCNFYAIVFHPSFIQSSINDVIEQSYIETYFTRSNKSFYYVNEKSKEHGKIYNRVKDIIETYFLKCFGYENWCP